MGLGARPRGPLLGVPAGARERSWRAESATPVAGRPPLARAECRRSCRPGTCAPDPRGSRRRDASPGLAPTGASQRRHRSCRPGPRTLTVPRADPRRRSPPFLRPRRLGAGPAGEGESPGSFPGGRRALGEKAFSSDPRGCLGVPDPPAAAPPLRVVAARSGHLPRVGNGPPPLAGARVERCSAYRGPRLPPPSRGRVPSGRAGVRRGAAVVCVCVRVSGVAGPKEGARGPTVCPGAPRAPRRPRSPPPPLPPLRPLPPRAAAGGLPRGHWVPGAAPRPVCVREGWLLSPPPPGTWAPESRDGPDGRSDERRSSR